MKNRKIFVSILGISALAVTAISMPSGHQPFTRPAHADEAKSPGLPYNGKPLEIPGTIQAEEYDISPGAKNDVTFHYTGAIAKTDVRKSPDSIGLARFGTDHVNTRGEPLKAGQAYVGWTQDGEWLKYSVHVAETGNYLIGGQFAAAGRDATLSFTFTPELKTGLVPVPTTDGYQPTHEVYHVWMKSDKLTAITLPKGDYVMTVKIEKAGGINMDYFTFEKDGMPVS